jgi:5-methyltetrahydrofolate--homocysteine methyltransferase
MARSLGGFGREGLINIAGGCCGNTPEHIAAIAKALEGMPPRQWERSPESAGTAQSASAASVEVTR